jgi:hypothetical protein
MMSMKNIQVIFSRAHQTSFSFVMFGELKLLFYNREGNKKIGYHLLFSKKRLSMIF